METIPHSTKEIQKSYQNFHLCEEQKVHRFTSENWEGDWVDVKLFVRFHLCEEQKVHRFTSANWEGEWVDVKLFVRLQKRPNQTSAM